MSAIYPQGPFTVCFEGVDGSGKTTHSKLLAQRMEAQGIPTLWTRQPGGSSSVNLRDLALKAEMIPKARHLLFAADNAQHIVDTVSPALKAGKAVIMDRGIGSAYAYQGWGEGFGSKRVALTYDWATDNFRPDLTILMGLTPDQVAERRDMLGLPIADLDQIESRGIEFQRKVWEGYQVMSQQPGWHTISMQPATSEQETVRLIDDLVCEQIKT